MEHYCLIGTESHFYKMERAMRMEGGDGCNNNVRVFNATELYTEKWVRW